MIVKRSKRSCTGKVYNLRAVVLYTSHFILLLTDCLYLFDESGNT